MFANAGADVILWSALTDQAPPFLRRRWRQSLGVELL
jgi:hypothetical protein